MSYEYFEPRREGCTPFGCGWTFLVVGLALALLGWFWNYPQVTYARGIVVESQPLRPPSMWRITYEYTAYGVQHRGERIIRLSTQFQPFYSVGSLFPVYFVTAHPEESYGPTRPIIQPLLWFGLFLAAGCSLIIYLTRLP
jgi:hypothetical protein